MKFLQVAILSAIFVSYVISSEFSDTELGKAINNKDLEAIRTLWSWDDRLSRRAIDYVTEKHDPDFLAKFIYVTGHNDVTTLVEICKIRTAEEVEKVLENVHFSQEDLVDRAAYHASWGETDKLLVLLDNIITPEDQEAAVERGVENLLYYSRLKYLVPLLDTLKSKTFRSKRLVEIAIQKVSEGGVKLAKETFYEIISERTPEPVERIGEILDEYMD